MMETGSRFTHILEKGSRKFISSVVFCAEAEYAFSMDKPIIPLLLEDNYWPDGWLGPLFLTNFYYNFARPEKLQSSWNKLLAELQAHKPSVDKQIYTS